MLLQQGPSGQKETKAVESLNGGVIMDDAALVIRNPANGELLRELEVDTAASVADKYQRARKAQEAWEAVSVEKRIQIISVFQELIEEKRDSLAQLLSQEMGKPISQSHAELSGVQKRITFFREHVVEVLLENPSFQVADSDVEEVIAYEPLGVIACISAWNYPYSVGANVFIPALLAGNSVLYKPSEFATLTGLEIDRLLKEAGVPKDVFIPAIGAGDVGGYVLDQDVDGVFFVGSKATGVKIAEAAARKLVPAVMELGGKDPVYIADDMDPELLIDGLVDGAFENTGQCCCSVERIYVHEKIYQPFVDAFVARVQELKVGNPLDENTSVGPLTRPQQVDVLKRQVADAVEKGAEVLTGGSPIDGPGNYFQPTVLVNVDHSMDLMREESFGPVIGIQKVSSDDEATELMKDTEYGLTAGVYTMDRRRAEAILKQIDTGTAYWNTCKTVSPRLPWGGSKASGFGRLLSYEGIRAFMKSRSWYYRDSI